MCNYVYFDYPSIYISILFNMLYDNAVAEAMYKIIKTEFVFNKIFSSLDELSTLLFDYVNWFNNFIIHGSLGYLSPIQYKHVAFN